MEEKSLRPEFITEHDYRHLTAREMIAYLEQYGTEEERSTFKYHSTHCKDGSVSQRMNVAWAKHEFCKVFKPELLKGRQAASEKMKDW